MLPSTPRNAGWPRSALNSMALWGRLSGGNASGQGAANWPHPTLHGVVFDILYLDRKSRLLTRRLANDFAPALCGNLRNLAVDDVDAAVGAGGECWIVGHHDDGLAFVRDVAED